MTARIRIPTALRGHTGGPVEFEVEGENVAQVLQELNDRHPDLTPYLYSEEGELRPRVNIYVNDEHIRFHQGLQTELHDGDLMYVMPLITGG